MRHFVFLLCVLPVSAESLRYSINWASGLSLGEATVRSDKAKDAWNFEVSMDASVPGFVLRDDYRSSANADLCSSELDKTFTHGPRKTDEKVTFDQKNHTAARETQNGGGKTDLPVGDCAKDALTFLQFARFELSQGRLPPQQAVVFGAAYQVRLVYTGAQRIRYGDQTADADRVLASIKGPVTDLTVEIFFARDAARTPLLARIPLALGSFTVELIR
ncbi:MAG TPA: DUF3108 domain-containing protein [Bryobacteraceae bacterium]|nr:DUF3108 domain-containing protein [Bryobacteraceae bacterium]